MYCTIVAIEHLSSGVEWYKRDQTISWDCPCNILLTHADDVSVWVADVMVLTLQHLGLTLWPDLPAVTPATRGYAVHCGSDALARGAHTLAGSASRDPCNTRLCCTLWFWCSSMWGSHSGRVCQPWPLQHEVILYIHCAHCFKIPLIFRASRFSFNQVRYSMLKRTWSSLEVRHKMTFQSQ